MSNLVDENSHPELNTVAAILQLQNQKILRDAELEVIRQKIDTLSSETAESISFLESSVSSIRDMARDAMHISVGVDGKNGLRGSMNNLTEQLHILVKEVGYLKQTADSYMEMRQVVLKYFATAALGLLAQFAGAIWYFSAQNQQQQALKQDLNKVLIYMDKQQENAKQLK